MSKQYHKGLVFINDLNLSSEKGKPLGRIDDNFTDAIKGKLEFVRDYAKENELKIVFFGDVFKKGFSSDAMTLFVSTFKNENPIILSSKYSESLNFLELFDAFEILDLEGTVEQVQIETDMGVEEYHIDYFNKIDKSYNGIEPHFGIDAKGILITGNYCDTEMPFNGIEAILCGKWETISNEMSHKAHCPTIIRQNVRDQGVKPSFPIWTPSEGIKFVQVPHQEFVFDEFDPTERLERSTKSEFSEMLAATTKLDFSDDDIPSVIDSLFAKDEIKGDVIDDLKFLYSEVTSVKEFA